MRVKIHPGARADLKEGKAFYRRHSPIAAVAFAREIEKALSQIAEAPQRHQLGELDTHEYVLPWRFPYTIVYRVQPGAVVVIAFAHQSREPGYWRQRK